MLKKTFLLFAILILGVDAAFSRPKSEADIDMKFLRLHISVDPAIRFIKASATEHFRLKNKSDRALPITIDLSDSLKVKKISHSGIATTYQHVNNKIKILPTTPWNDYDSITIEYEGAPSSSGLGSAMFQKHDGIPIFWTLSEPYGAKDWFPCKQDISDKIDSTFLIISCPKRYRAASNGKVFSEKVLGDTRVTEWRHKYPCSYYLIAVSVTEYKVYSDWVVSKSDSFEIVNYVYPERYDQCKRKTWKLAGAFKMMCDSFGPYPFRNEKYGHAQFGWAGGMEHQTMSFMVSFDLDLMIHELAHQWFGDMITCKSWQDVFLNEAFATYCEELATEKGFASGSDPVQWRKATIQRACNAKHESLHISDTSDIHKLFDTKVVYHKGAMMLHMLRRELGDAMFFTCIKAYANDRRLKYGSASAKDFIKIVNTVSGKNMDWFFAQWVYGSGYPIYHIEWQQLGNNILNLKVTQSTTDSSVSFFRSKIPIILHGDNGEKVFFRLTNYYNRQKFTLSPNFEVKYVTFDPYGDVLSKGTKVENSDLATNCNIIVKSETKSGKIKITVPDEDSFNWYTLRDEANKVTYKGRVPNSGKLEIHTNNIPEGNYLLQLDGRDYYATTINIYHPKKQ